MSDLIVIGYDSPNAADAARADLLAVAKAFDWDIEDALIAKADAGGAIRFQQMVDVWAIGASGGGLWGVLAGMLFMDPQRSGRPEGSDPALVGSEDDGIGAEAMAEIAVMLSPGHAAFCLLTRASPSEAMMDRLAATGAEIMRTRLDHRTEANLRHVFARPPAQDVTRVAG